METMPLQKELSPTELVQQFPLPWREKLKKEFAKPYMQKLTGFWNCEVKIGETISPCPE